MSSRLSKLEEVATIVDSLHKTPGYIETGHPMVRVTDVKYGFLDLSKALRVNEDTFLEFSRRYKPSKADIIVTRVGTYGVFSKVLDTHFCLGQNTAAIIPNQIDADYLYAALNSSFVRAQIEASVVGSTQKTLSLRLIGKLEIPRLEEKYELLIAELSSYLDNRITLLRETNSTLEAIAQVLFKSWFVDFDPVRAKQEGRQPEGLDEATAALFPDSFEQSELGEIPRGWLLSTFRNTIEIIGGGTPKTSVAEYWGGNIPWFSVVDAPHISDVFVVDTEKHITDAGLKGSSAKLLAVGTTIISARGTVGRIALTGCPMAMNQSCYGLRGKAGDQYYTFFNTKRIVDQLKQRAHGSVFDTITQETFSGILVCYSSGNLIQCFEKLIEPLMLRIRENLLMANNLASLRDTLLPRLISGQLRLPEIDSLLEESVL